MADSPLPFTGGVGGGLVRSFNHLNYSDMPSPTPSHKWEGNK